MSSPVLHPIRSIVVLGGGTAGWMAAAYLNKVLRAVDGDKPLSITVIESEEIGTIGVGEATVPTLRNMLAILEVPEWEFLAATDATFKFGVKFHGWKDGAQGSRESPADEYFHFFEAPRVFAGHSTSAHWLSLKDRGAPVPPYHDAVAVAGALCREYKAPKLFTSMPYEAPLPYAYHLDAVKFGQLLCRIATARGVNHVRDRVVSVNRSDDGSISGLQTANSGEFQADFFIDCSGFSSLLIGKALQEPFCDWRDYLPCDRAVALQVDYDAEPDDFRPYTTATALESGWAWEIDLFTRKGNGYVYASDFLDRDGAESRLRQFLGVSESGGQARHLAMQIGHRRNMWSGNCLALGLAAGFIEPLESTAIYLVEIALSLFVDHIATGQAAPYLAHRFNRKMQCIYEEVRDFVQLHYILSERRDSAFWRAIAEKIKVSDSLKHKLDLWTFKLPGVTDLDGQLTLFGPSSYTYILAGMGRVPALGGNLSPYINPVDSAKALVETDQVRGRACQASPLHAMYLRKQRSVGRT